MNKKEIKGSIVLILLLLIIIVSAFIIEFKSLQKFRDFCKSKGGIGASSVDEAKCKFIKDDLIYYKEYEKLNGTWYEVAHG